MPSIRLVSVLALAAIFTAPPARAQTFPVTAGTREFQLGLAAIALPEEQDGAFSGEIEGRAGWFVREGIELQAEAAARVYPLGSVAPKSYGAGVSALWFPTLGEVRNLYLLGGLAFQYLDYPANTGIAKLELVRAKGAKRLKRQLTITASVVTATGTTPLRTKVGPKPKH